MEDNALKTARVVNSDTVDQYKPGNPDFLRIVCVSDTHSQHEMVQLPPGDILVHTGDFSMKGRENEVRAFNKWLGKIPFKHKVVVAGNHEVTFEDQNEPQIRHIFGLEAQPSSSEMKKLLTNCTYLQDSFCEVEGLKIYGTPHQPVFFNWAFNREDEQRQKLFSAIPSDSDIVLCHGPPYNILDKVHDGQHVGCPIMRKEMLERVKPKLMVFGHIHEDHGVEKIDNTIFVNAANCTVRYKCTQKPIVVDIPRKQPLVQP